MPPRIIQLPDDLVARIAAGEVVERPASVLKELIENSLDAGATHISVTVQGAGRMRLRISDNGCGMTRADALLSLKRHATSKIKAYEDLETIATFGFRGEAMPSIASVSRMTLTTRSADEEMGWELELEGGKLISEKPAAREPGTTIDVRDLFFNTPARFKFLKSDATERGQCLRVIEENLFSSLGVTFEIQTEDQRPVVFRSGQAENAARPGVLKNRIGEAWGPRWRMGLKTVAAESPHFRLWGVLTDQAHHQATPRNQFLFINGRPVLQRRLSRATYDGYRGQLPSLRHPSWVLFLELDPKAVDVNVHPAKREVKLTFESEIYGFIVSAVQKALSENRETSVGLFKAEPAPAPVAVVPVVERPQPALVAEALNLYRPAEPSSWTPASAARSEAAAQTAELPIALEALTAVAQVGLTYIVAESGSELFLVDQHAAQEKVIYERIFKNIKAGEPAVQMMLVPFSWEASLSVAAELKGRLPALAKMGFMIEPFGGSTFLVKGYPQALGDKFDLHSLLDALTDDLAGTDDRRGGLDRDFSHRLAAGAACKAAVKAGDALKLVEAQKILNDLGTLEHPLTCPHGRPTMIRFSYEELGRRFRRS